MLIQIVCHCGSPIGQVAEVFRALRRERVKAYLAKTGVEPSMAAVRAAEADIDMSDTIERLGVVHDCCKMHLVTAVDWREYY